MSVSSVFELLRNETVETNAAAGLVLVDPFRNAHAVDKVIRIRKSFPSRYLEHETQHDAFPFLKKETAHPVNQTGGHTVIWLCAC